ncbi:hypothetical protein PV327_001490 [Microctonus hyperodae]|uniref:Coiled-coil protein 142 C-terminal domain-containing protein n=1 Tax=Microctonus hyperodae TaxID=165561 RepID=A0AA39G8C3_MICHY|nr:hypothetical protein PV327_001490 [Microctonus hyperodae]
MMENNCYRVNITKWLPISDSLSSSCVKMIELKNAIVKHTQNIILMTNQIYNCDDSHCQEMLDKLTTELKNIIFSYESMYSTRINSNNTLQAVDNYKINYLFSNIKRLLHVMAKFHYNLINKIIGKKNDEITRNIFRLVNVYNSILELKSEVTLQPTINIFSNDCPSTLDLHNKNISTMRIFQILAKNKAEEHCHVLINCLLKIYQPGNNENSKSPPSADEISENSSVEIYRALTKHMTPPHTSTKTLSAPVNEVSNENHDAGSNIDNIETIRMFVINQTKHIEKLLDGSNDISSSQLFEKDIFNRNNNGHMKISKRELEKISNYYRRISWAAASEILDHVVLWWSSEGIAARHNLGAGGAHDLQDWLHQFIQDNKNKIPTCIKLTLLNLCDALGCHVTITCWDKIFRLAYIAAFENISKPFSTEGTDTGHMFAEVFQLLVSLSNKCEIGGEWMIGAPLMELALSEQIIILHRLDHSIHTMRLWASQECKLIAHTWDLESFFLIVKGDVNNCINELSFLKLADHTIALTVDCATISVQVYMCAKMRAKIVSEVNANMLLLKKSSSSSIEILAKICRVVSMANLHMCLPLASYWSKTGATAINNQRVSGITPSSYVEIYLERVLLPVLEVLEDHEICNMVLKIMCEAWLDYIYLDQVKFSEFGSYQLLTDFAYISNWIAECSIIPQNMKEHLMKNEVLRRCEGVGKLLLRHPGEAISMKKQIGTMDGSPTATSLGLERMPAEMYVPNQEQWLELRAGRNCSLCRCLE